MAQAVFMGLLSAGTTALTGGTMLGGFLLGAGAAGTFFTHFLVTTAMGAALNALSPKPSSGAGGYSITGESGAALDHQVIYGKTKVGGVRIYDSTTGENNKYLHRILAFAGHEISSYEEIYINEDLVTIDAITGNVTSPTKYSGKVRIKRYYGTVSQAADPDLIAETTTLTNGAWTTSHKLSNIAYLYVRFQYDTNIFTNGVPSVSAVIKGKKVYDPRTGLTAWSDNTALCLRDYLINGFQAPVIAKNYAIGAGYPVSTTYFPASSLQNGITCTKIGYGIEDGLPYVDYQFTGTATATSVNNGIYALAYSRIAAEIGQTWSASFIGRKLSGSGAVGLDIGVVEETAPSTNIGGTFCPTSDSTVDNLYIATRTLSVAGVNQVRTVLRLFFNSGSVINATYRIKGIQLEQSSARTTWQADLPSYNLQTSGYGFGLATDPYRMSDDHIIAAANICDQTVTETPVGGTGTVTEKRYTCNGAFLTSSAPNNIISNMLTSMGGLFWYSGGMWKMKASAYTTPTITLTDDDLRSSVSVSTRFSRRDNFNSVKGTFRGSESNWQEADYPSVTLDSALEADNNLLNVADYSLPFTSSSLTAQRIARVFLNRNREQLTIQASWGLKAFQVEVGDIVYVTLERFGWTSKPFEVTSWTFGAVDTYDLQASIILREISPEVFTNTDGLIFEQNNTTLPDPTYVPSIGVVLSSDVVTTNEQPQNIINVNVTANDEPSVESIEIQYKLSSSSTWTSYGTSDLGTTALVGVATDPYDVRVQARNYLGVKGDWVTVSNYTVDVVRQKPADVTGFEVMLNNGSVTLSWDASSDTDLSYYVIRHSVDETGATWANSVLYVQKVARPATTVTVPAKPGTYMVKAVDKLGLESEIPAYAVVPANSLETFANTVTTTESPTFAGTKTGCAVLLNNLYITGTTGSGPYIATYLFNNYTDLTTAKKFRARIDVDVSRYITGGGSSQINFDDLTGRVDSWTGLWDDLTTNALEQADTNIICYIRTTNDNPAGTPTWSSWRELRSGDFYARAAQFRIIMVSQTQNVTPIVPTLKSVVQYN